MTSDPGTTIPVEWFESVYCGYCGNDRFRIRKVVDGYRAVKCRNCGLTYTNPRIREERSDDLYNLEYYHFSDASWTNDHLDSFRRELVRMGQFTKGRKLLEIGCGGGKFLRCADELGWEVEGQEISTVCADHIRSEYGFPVTTRRVEEMGATGRTFDAVAMFHVLEHVFRPIEFLSACRALLSEEGILVIGVPNTGSPDLLLDGELLRRNLHLPYHNYHFTERTLMAFLRKAGFRETLIDRGVSKHLVSHNRTGSTNGPPAESGGGSVGTDPSSASGNKGVKGFLKRGLKPVISRILPGVYLVVYADRGSRRA